MSTGYRELMECASWRLVEAAMAVKLNEDKKETDQRQGEALKTWRAKNRCGDSGSDHKQA